MAFLEVPYDWTVENVGSDGVKILSPSRLNWLGITVARNDEHLQAKAVIDGYKQGIGSDLKVNSEKSSGPNYYFLNGEFRGYRVEMMGLIDNAGYIHGYITINDVPVMTDIVNSVRILNY